MPGITRKTATTVSVHLSEVPTPPEAAALASLAKKRNSTFVVLHHALEPTRVDVSKFAAPIQASGSAELTCQLQEARRIPCNPSPVPIHACKATACVQVALRTSCLRFAGKSRSLFLTAAFIDFASTLLSLVTLEKLPHFAIARRSGIGPGRGAPIDATFGDGFTPHRCFKCPGLTGACIAARSASVPADSRSLLGALVVTLVLRLSARFAPIVDFLLVIAARAGPRGE